MASAIERRGGKVVFVRMPTSDEHWALDESKYPKALYWDRFAAVAEATAIHFLDVPGLAGFECPDTSHLDTRDSVAFTGRLVHELLDRGVIDRRIQRANASAAPRPD